jgi:HAD superfamily hydrolase (TIGR01509 family)
MKINAVIFDLDGTITRPYLDFNQIRAEIGSAKGPLLEEIQKMTPPDRNRAEKILHRHEFEAAEKSELNPGVIDVLNILQLQQRRLGIVTRNRRESVERVCRIHGLRFEEVATREDGPVKPDPYPVLLVCGRLGVEPHEALVVGDYVFDVVSARRAGAVSVLFRSQDHSWGHENEADYVIDALAELPGVIAAIENGVSQ